MALLSQQQTKERDGAQRRSVHVAFVCVPIDFQCKNLLDKRMVGHVCVYGCHYGRTATGAVSPAIATADRTRRPLAMSSDAKLQRPRAVTPGSRSVHCTAFADVKARSVRQRRRLNRRVRANQLIPEEC